MSITKVVDANNKEVGNLIFVISADEALVEIKIAKVSYFVGVEHDRLIQTDSPQSMWWKASSPTGPAPGCGNGQAFVALPLQPSPPMTSMLQQLLARNGMLPLAFSLPGWTVYKPDLSVAPETVSLPFACTSADGRSCSCDDGAGTPPVQTLVPAIVVINLQDLYVPPFRFA